jgi:hypothetical protein
MNISAYMNLMSLFICDAKEATVIIEIWSSLCIQTIHNSIINHPTTHSGCVLFTINRWLTSWTKSMYATFITCTCVALLCNSKRWLSMDGANISNKDDCDSYQRDNCLSKICHMHLFDAEVGAAPFQKKKHYLTTICDHRSCSSFFCVCYVLH